jgi:hypothetical protein
MNTVRQISNVILLSILAACWHTQSAQGQTDAGAQASHPPAALRDGRHDFDFNIGTWKTHYRRLLHPLTGSKDWVEFDGTVGARDIWEGRAARRDRSR